MKQTDNRKSYLWNILATTPLFFIPILFDLEHWGMLLWTGVIFYVTMWVVYLFIMKDPSNQNQSPKVMRLALWILPVLSLMCQTMTIAIIGAHDISVVARISCVVEGLLAIVIGNYMPKMSPNHTIGVRIYWTLNSEDNWNATHRFAGKVWVAAGFLALLLSFLPVRVVQLANFILILAIGILPLAYSYSYYKKHNERDMHDKPFNGKKTAVITLIILVASTAFTAWVLLAGSLDISLQSDEMMVQANGWSDMGVLYEDMETLEYLADERHYFTNDTRVNGYGNMVLNMGDFACDEYGAYLRYTHTSCSAVVLIWTTEGELIVVNGPTTEETQQLYQELSQKNAH